MRDYIRNYARDVHICIGTSWVEGRVGSHASVILPENLCHFTSWLHRLVPRLSTHNGLCIFLIKGRRVLAPSSPPSRCNESPPAGRNKCKKLEEYFSFIGSSSEAEHPRLVYCYEEKVLQDIFLFFFFFYNKR